MKKVVLIIVFIFSFATAALSASTNMQESMHQFVKLCSPCIGTNQTVALLGFNSIDNTVSQKAQQYMRKELEASGVHLIDDKSLKAITKKYSYDSQKEANVDTICSIGKAADADFVVFGKITLYPSLFQIEFALHDTESKSLIKAMTQRVVLDKEGKALLRKIINVDSLQKLTFGVGASKQFGSIIIAPNLAIEGFQAGDDSAGLTNPNTTFDAFMYFPLAGKVKFQTGFGFELHFDQQMYTAKDGSMKELSLSTYNIPFLLRYNLWEKRCVAYSLLGLYLTYCNGTELKTNTTFKGQGIGLLMGAGLLIPLGKNNLDLSIRLARNLSHFSSNYTSFGKNYNYDIASKATVQFDLGYSWKLF